MITLPLPRHWYKQPTAQLETMLAELNAQPVPDEWEAADVLENAIDCIREEIHEREHDRRDPSAGAAFGHFPS